LVSYFSEATGRFQGNQGTSIASRGQIAAVTFQSNPGRELSNGKDDHS
jgi:hypothetical protein